MLLVKTNEQLDTEEKKLPLMNVLQWTPQQENQN